MKYPNYAPLIDLAQPSSGLGRLIVGVAMITVGYLALSLLYFTMINRLIAPANWPQFLAEMTQGNTARGMLYFLGSFGMMIAAVWVPLRLIHRRRLLEVFGPPLRAMWGFVRVSGAIIALLFVLSLFPIPADYALVANLDASVWRSVLPLAILAVFIQITAEELVFRGYLQSQLAARFRHSAVWICGPSLLFGLLHYDPSGAGGNAYLVVISATLFGIIAADLTARSGTLGPAMAVHFVTNLNGILFAAPAQGLNGLALYTYPFAMDDIAAARYWMPLDVMFLITAWLAARVIIKQ